MSRIESIEFIIKQDQTIKAQCKKVRVTSKHISLLSRRFHFHAVPGLVRFSFPNLGRCEAMKRKAWFFVNLSLFSHLMCHVNVYDVCFFRFFGNLALWAIWALWEYSPIQPWSFTRLTLAKLRPGNESKCICTENDGAKLDLYKLIKLYCFQVWPSMRTLW